MMKSFYSKEKTIITFDNVTTTGISIPKRLLDWVCKSNKLWSRVFQLSVKAPQKEETQFLDSKKKLYEQE